MCRLSRPRDSMQHYCQASCILVLFLFAMVDGLIVTCMHAPGDYVFSLRPGSVHPPAPPPTPRKHMRFPYSRSIGFAKKKGAIFAAPVRTHVRSAAAEANVTAYQGPDEIQEGPEQIPPLVAPKYNCVQKPENCVFGNDTCSCADVFALQARVHRAELIIQSFYALETRMLRAESIIQELVSAVLVCDELAILEREVSKSSTYNPELTKEQGQKYLKNVIHNITKRHGVGIVPLK